MTAIDLFAGCGGASLGLRAAGVDLVAAYELDRRACEGHEALLPGCPVWAHDLAGIDPMLIPSVDLWWASPPCQPFSSAGDRLGAKDPRNGYPHLLRLLDRAARPRWLVIENVPGLDQHESKAGCAPMFPQPDACKACYFRQVVLPSLDDHFRVVHLRTLDAADFGVPQHRDRIFTVCGPTRVTWPESTHGPGRARPWISAGEALGLTGTIQHGGTRGGKGYLHTPTEEPAPGIGTAGDVRLVAIAHTGSRHSDGIPLTEPAPAMTASRDLYLMAGGVAGDGVPTSIEEPSPTVSGKGSSQIVDATYRRIRTLTVRERATLQALPWQDGLTGKMVGNAVPPPLARVVVEAVMVAARMAA